MSVIPMGVQTAEAMVNPAAYGGASQGAPLLSLEKSLCQHFSEQVSRSPSRVAVADAALQLTYAQLDAWSDRIAIELAAGGFGRGHVAACLLERTCGGIAAILGVLKAGGAYVPIDLHTPANRLRSILQDSNARILMATPEVADQLDCRGLLKGMEPAASGSGDPAAKGPSCQLVLLGSKYEEQGGEPKPLGSPAGPRDLAYIIYTSGSTGKPKGSMIEHRSVVNLVEGLHQAILAQHGPHLRVAVVAPFVFDPSVQQIFSALLLGHALYLATDEARRDARLLADFFVRNNIEISDGTPAHLKLLARAPRAVGQSLPVKHFIIGGETLRYADVSNFLNRYTSCRPRITNIYGTAECAVDSCCYTIDRDDLTAPGNVPIGKPLVNSRMYVVDENLKPRPPGEVGELCIGGEGVGRGYAGDPAQTAKRFVRNPFEPGGMLYRTGDLGLCRPDGTFEHHGRVDTQMKVRGYRIEPSEIESKLLSYRPIEAGAASAQAQAKRVVSCSQCLLTTAFPKVVVDEEGVCNVCRSFETYRAQLMPYFGITSDFEEVLREARKTKQSEFDCMLLYSGGKDSSYVLYKLVAMGLKVLTFTFDNGFISKGAFENIERITRTLGVEHVTMTLARMREVFAESLKEDKTVCSGCFRSLTSISTRLAAERGINVVITGLSRGQIFDTKLKQFFDANIFDPEDIERGLVTHRKMYHARQDRIASLMGTEVEPSMIDSIRFVDYFRYDPVSSPGIMSFLASCDKRWLEPSDTGFCSTNCLINNVGIYVHQTELGYHNYASPLSWEIRLGLISREEGLESIGERTNTQSVRQILRLINYTPKRSSVIMDAAVVKHGEDALAAYVVSERELDMEAVREHLKAELPEYMVPGKIVRVPSLPLTNNGKLDVSALAALGPVVERQAERPVPTTETERRVLAVWQNAFEREDIRVDEDFMHLGGSSLKATMVINLIEEEFNVNVPLATVFDHPTVRDLSKFIDQLTLRRGEAASDEGIVLLNPGDVPRANLFLVHDVSGWVDGLRELSQQLAPDIRAWGILAERQQKEHLPLPDITEMARGYLQRLRNKGFTGPWHLGGWSFGGMLAYEMARQLSQAGEAVASLTIIDAEAPDAQRWEKVLADWVTAIRAAFPPASAAVAKTSGVAEQCQLLLQRITRFGRGVDWVRQNAPAEVKEAISGWNALSNSELTSEAARVAAVIGSLSRYTPSGRLATRAQVVQASASGDGTWTGWEQLIDGGAHRHVVEGDHHSILAAPTVASLAGLLNKTLA